MNDLHVNKSINSDNTDNKSKSLTQLINFNNSNKLPSKNVNNNQQDHINNDNLYDDISYHSDEGINSNTNNRRIIKVKEENSQSYSANLD